MSTDDLSAHLEFYGELGVTGVRREPEWRQREERARAVAEPAGASLAGEPATEPAGEPAAETIAATVMELPEVVPVFASAQEALDAVRHEIGPQCTRCTLHTLGRKQVVFGEGAVPAPVMFVGEAPGFHEDREGRPFVGAAGQLLDRIITNAMGLRRDEVYIANVIKCRPPENRDPEPDEVAACLPYLREQVRLVQPRVIVCLGRVAARALLGTDQSMARLRGQDLTFDGIAVVATWHPAYLLRKPEAKAETWEDIKRVNRLLGRPEVPGR